MGPRACALGARRVGASCVWIEIDAGAGIASAGAGSDGPSSTSSSKADPNPAKKRPSGSTFQKRAEQTRNKPQVCEMVPRECAGLSATQKKQDGC